MLLALQSVAGMVVIMGAAWALAPKGGRLPAAAAIRIAAVGLALQLAIALVLLKIPNRALSSTRQLALSEPCKRRLRRVCNSSSDTLRVARHRST